MISWFYYFGYAMENETDFELMVRIKDDHIPAFELLYHRYQKILANFFFRMGCMKENIEDCVQEVFMRLWKSRKNYVPTAKFTTFLFEIAKNYWLNEVDKIKRRPHLYSIHSPSDKDETWHDPPSADPLPPTSLQQQELQSQIQDAIASLKEKHRTVFVLSEIQGLKYQEIADILHIPIGTVKSRMVLAEKKLRAKLQKYWDIN